MSRNDRTVYWYRLKLGLIVMGISLLPIIAAGEELDVTRYVELTIARLEMADTTWTQEQRGPTESEEADLLESLGTTAEAYYQFSGENREEIESYLDANPDLRNEISKLGERIRASIERMEGE